MNLSLRARNISRREKVYKNFLSSFFWGLLRHFFSPKAEKMEATFTQTLLPRAGGFITSRGKKKTTKRSRRRGCLSRGVCARASSSSSSDDDDDKNKAPLNSLHSAIELRSKLQEVALAARTRCVESMRVYTRTERFLFFFLSLSLSLSLTTLCILCVYKQTKQQSRKQLERYFQRPNGVRVRTKVAVDDVGIRALSRRSRLRSVPAGVLR